MKDYFLEMSCGLAGTTTYEKLQAENEVKALELGREKCVDWADGYGFEQNMEYFGDLDQLGREWDEELEEYTEEGSLEYYVVPWNEEEHRDYIL